MWILKIFTFSVINWNEPLWLKFCLYFWWFPDFYWLIFIIAFPWEGGLLLPWHCPYFVGWDCPHFFNYVLSKSLHTLTENKIYFNFFCLGNWQRYVVSHFWLNSAHFVILMKTFTFQGRKCTENSKSGRSNICNYCSSSKMIMRIKIGYHISCSIIDYS